MTSALFIENGDVLLPGAGAFERTNILAEDGVITALGPDLTAPDHAETVDAAGNIVTPGLIDFHVHAFRYGHYLSIDTDEVAHRSGTTTFVDAGTTGSLNFMAFRDFVIKPAQSNILAFLHISAIGQTTDGCAGLTFHDASDDNLIHLASAKEIIEKNRDYIVGIKVRAYTGLQSRLSLEKARELADMVDLPIMVHLAPAPPTFQQIVPFLRAGDIITHPYHGGSTRIVDEDCQILPEYWEARNSGIEVDLGLDRFHGSLNVMKACFEQGFYPDYISTDLTTTNIDNIVFDMPTTIEKIVACGMPLTEALHRSTATGAKKLGMEDEIGSIKLGASADIAIFERDRSPGTVVDFEGTSMSTDERLVAVATFRRGKRLESPGRELETLDVLNRANPWVSYEAAGNPQA